MNKDCRHIKTNGHKCGSTAVREEHYCYYHPGASAPPGRQATTAVYPLNPNNHAISPETDVFTITCGQIPQPTQNIELRGEG
jgi:hypothetical protein